jgi:endonuclease-3
MTPQDAVAIIDALSTQHPNADTELHHRNAFELLIATILSAQSTDAGVNSVTPALFARYPDARALAAADTADLEPMIHATGFFRQKARSMTANVVLGHALGVPGLPVDRHVLRVANRIGLASGDDAVKVEQTLCGLLPPKKWVLASDVQILHGRRICRPKPLCDRCAVKDRCAYVRNLGAATKPASRRRATPREPRRVRTPRG